MNFTEALQTLDQGKKVKLPEWIGYWFKEDNKILVHTRIGEILDSPYLEDYKNRTDWQITDGLRDFGGALIPLKLGKLVTREKWNSLDKFLFIRPFDQINKEVIPNIKSLPSNVKDYISNKNPIYGNFPVNFTEYICLCDHNTIINGWIPTQEDILAEDWFIISSELYQY